MPRLGVMLLLPAACGMQLAMPWRRLSHAAPTMSAVEGTSMDSFEEAKQAVLQQLQEAQSHADETAAALADAESALAAAIAAEKAAPYAGGDPLLTAFLGEPKAVREAKVAAAEDKAAAELAIEETTVAVRPAAEALEVARTEADAALAKIAAEQAEWEQDHPMELVGPAVGEAGIAIGNAALALGENVTGSLLTSIFGEPKAQREAREAEVRAAAAAVAAEEARKAEEAAARDAEMRRRREEAEAQLKTKRARPLSESIATGAFDAALAAAAATARVASQVAAERDGGEAAEGGGLGDAVASWASEQRQNLKSEVEATEKLNRMKLFESDLEMLGLSLDDATELTSHSLRKAFRERSRVLHPDVIAQQRAEELEGVPSVYELNAAYDAVRKLL